MLTSLLLLTLQLSALAPCASPSLSCPPASRVECVSRGASLPSFKWCCGIRQDERRGGPLVAEVADRAHNLRTPIHYDPTSPWNPSDGERSGSHPWYQWSTIGTGRWDASPPLWCRSSLVLLNAGKSNNGMTLPGTFIVPTTQTVDPDPYSAHVPLPPQDLLGATLPPLDAVMTNIGSNPVTPLLYQQPIFLCKVVSIITWTRCLIFSL
jgi:hypothetical protein